MTNPYRTRVIVLKVPLSSEERPGYVHPVGTEVKIIETLGGGAAFIVEIATPDEGLVGGFWFDVIEVSRSDLMSQ
jgi:hypothetical protein